MLAICNNLGLLPDRFSKNGGRDYELSPYLNELKSYRDDFTVLSGVSHPGVDDTHSSDVSFLTCAPHPGGVAFATPFPSINLSPRKSVISPGFRR